MSETGIDCLSTHMYTHVYLPKIDTAEVREYVIRHPFAQLITASPEAGLHCTAVTAVPESEGAEHLTLVSHLARRNPHAQALDHVRCGLLLFQGRNAYISPRWYEGRPDVPTWNYIAVQARGTLELIDDAAGIESILLRTIDRMERGASPPWKLEQVPGELRNRLVTGIRGFRFRVQTLEGVFKLSQNKTDSERARIIAGLRATGSDDDAAMAAFLEAGTPNIPK